MTAAGSTIIGGTELRAEDFAKAYPRLPAFRRLRWILLALPIVWAFSAITTVVGGARPVTVLTLPALLPPVVGILAAIALGLWIPHSWARRSLAAMGGGRVTFRFDDEGLYYEAPARQFKLGWGALPQHIDVGDSFAIYTSEQTLLIVPKRAFADADVATLGQMLQARIPPLRQRTFPLRLVIWVLAMIFFLSVWHFLSIDAAPH
ncbi:MAG TPA: YcxB family protein [Polyangiaceae bacterium]|nr:YcxB family protein [Polyangiaceae bacterium]